MSDAVETVRQESQRQPRLYAANVPHGFRKLSLYAVGLSVAANVARVTEDDALPKTLRANRSRPPLTTEGTVI